MNETIPILVTQNEEPTYRDITRSPASTGVDRVVQVAADALRDRVGTVVGLMSDVLAAVPDDGGFEVSEFRFMLNVGGNGEVSLMSFAKAGVVAGAGIEVTLKKRDAV